MRTKHLIGFFCLAFWVLGCAEDPVPWQEYVNLPNKQMVLKIDMDCCMQNESCSARPASWVAKSRGEICESVANAMIEAGQNNKAMAAAFTACDLGYDASAKLLDVYGKPGRQNTGGQEDKMLSYCLNSKLVAYYGIDNTGDYCYSLSAAFDKAGQKGLALQARKKACNTYDNLSACQELNEWQGNPFTREVWTYLWEKGNKREEQVERAKNAYHENRRKEIHEKLEDERDNQNAQEASDRAFRDGFNSTFQLPGNQSSSGDATQLELDRQMARLREAGRRQNEPTPQPIPRPTPPPTPRPAAPPVTTPELFVPPVTLRPWLRDNQPSTNVTESAPADPAPNQAVLYADDGAPLPAPSPPPPKERGNYHPANLFDNCVEFFYDPDMYNWYSLRNNCGEAITWVSSRHGSGDTNPGGKSCTGESRAEVATHLDWTFAVCRKDFIPVDANDKYWSGGPYRCKHR